MAADLVIPPSLPLPMVQGAIVNAISPSERTPFEAGVARRRRVFRNVPRTATVVWRLGQAGFDVWSDFFERDLHAGAYQFDLQFAGEGVEAAVWWSAAVMSHVWEMPFSARYLVTAQLLLLGDPVGVRVPTTLRGSLSAASSVTLAGVLSTDPRLRGSVVAWATSVRGVIRPSLYGGVGLVVSLRGTLS